MAAASWQLTHQPTEIVVRLSRLRQALAIKKKVFSDFDHPSSANVHINDCHPNSCQFLPTE